MLASSYPVLDLFLTILYFFMFFIWIWLLIVVFGDIFRSHDLGGMAKALWCIFIIVIPFFGVFMYLIARGGKMHERAAQRPRSSRRLSTSTCARPPGRRARTPPPSSRSWPTSRTRACSPTPSSRRRRRRSWPNPAFTGYAGTMSVRV